MLNASMKANRVPDRATVRMEMEPGKATVSRERTAAQSRRLAEDPWTSDLGQVAGAGLGMGNGNGNGE